MLTFFANLQQRYKLDINRVVQDYDEFLRHSLVTTRSFQNTQDERAHRKEGTLQLLFIVFLLFYLVPKYSFLVSLYFQAEDTRLRYQYLLADYNEEMGLLGRTFNTCYVVFATGVLFNIFVIRKYEATASLQFLTDWVTRLPKKQDAPEETHVTSNEEIFGYLNNEMRYRLFSQLHYKMLFFKLVARTINLGCQTFNIIACLLFLYRKRPSFLVSCQSVFNCLLFTWSLETTGNHYNSLYLAFFSTTDYFKCRIDGIISEINDLKNEKLTKENLAKLLDNYDDIMFLFEKYNKSLRHLLRNMVDFYAVALTACFFMLTIETETWMLVIMIMSGGGASLTLMATGIYVSQLHSQTIELHGKLSALCATHSRKKGLFGSLKNLLRLRLILKELGSPQTDGQFVVGFRDGEGAAISRMEIFELTLVTISNTLMMIEFINHN